MVMVILAAIFSIVMGLFLIFDGLMNPRWKNIFITRVLIILSGIVFLYTTYLLLKLSFIV